MNLFIDVASDTHVDNFKNKPINWKEMKNEGSDVLVLAGDLAHYESSFYKVLNDTRDVYKHIVVVSGNHCTYTVNQEVSKWCDKTEKYINKRYDNITFLNGRNSFKINNTVFIGANGWYDFKCYEPLYSYDQAQFAWKRFLNDYNYVRFDDNNLDYGPDVLAEKHFKQLKRQVVKFQKDDSVDNIVVVTHTVPRKELVQLKNDYNWDICTPSFVNTQMVKLLDSDKKKKIKIHCFGHTHTRSDDIIDGVRYVNNCRGYPGKEEQANGGWTLKQIEI